MANHKRKRSKRSVKCTMCTQHRWMGNSRGRDKAKNESKKKASAKEIKEAKSK